MSGRLEGRVAFITGAARGQGRAHAVRMAKEGADIISVDLAGKLPPCVPYDPATPEDLDETVKLVEETGRRILASVVDTRDSEAMNAAVEAGVSELGRLDIIVANAGPRRLRPGTTSVPTISGMSWTATSPGRGTRSWPARRRSSTAAAAGRSS